MLTESTVINRILSYLNTARIITHILKESRESTMSNSLPMPSHCSTPPKKMLKYDRKFGLGHENKRPPSSLQVFLCCQIQHALHHSGASIWKGTHTTWGGDYKLSPEQGENPKKSTTEKNNNNTSSRNTSSHLLFYY